MEVRSVEMFLRVLEQGSVTGAARTVGVTQPAVSGAIARLAPEPGFDLFRRHGRVLVPTRGTAIRARGAPRDARTGTAGGGRECRRPRLRPAADRSRRHAAAALPLRPGLRAAQGTRTGCP